MESIRQIFSIGFGPSSSHTMGPRRAAEIFKARNWNAVKFRVTLYDSLAATGKGHLTDLAITNGLAPQPVEIIWKPELNLVLHPNGMEFEALNASGERLAFWRVYSIGGGALREEGSFPSQVEIYDLTTMESIIDWAEQNHKQFLVQIPCIERNAFAASRAIDCAEYALLTEGKHRITFDEVVQAMMQTGKDLKSCYRETATGGLAAISNRIGEENKDS